MAEYTQVETVVTTDHTPGFHVFGYVLDGAFHPVGALDTGHVEAAVKAAGTETDGGEAHPLAVGAKKSSGKG